MAANKAEMEKSESNLKHLGFVRLFAINTAVLVSNLYDYAKQNSGPLRSTVGTVEKAVTTVVRPVYERFKGVPDEVLVFLDKKVDDGTAKFDEHAPPLAKKVVSKVQSLFQKASEVAQDLSKDIQVAGPRAAVYHAGELSKQFATSQVAVLWYHVNQCPPLHGIAQMAAPTAAHWSDKYNQLVADWKEKGYSIISYIPLIPVEEISLSYKHVESAATKKEGATNLSSSKSE
ncbi:REF/SRPP-like protein At1g67360 [Solanum dulcamara]|uniref:REF/SRPP-like protein At1g67360 n=1 Tax=Solanum dulcamara TaxID=45834 RepID=UPI002485C7BD|nr:REF/SRPP-like protein At1g67360 [Solanum dulcamara]